MDRKSKYIEFCEKHEVPLHVQPWWLDCVCGKNQWDVALSFDAGGNLTGALPYHFSKKMGLTLIKMPPLTDYSGVVFNFDNQQQMKPYAHEAFRQRVLTGLVAQLPKVALFHQQYYPELDNWLPFLWAGFRQTTTYTYRLEDLTDLQRVFDSFKSSVRTNIRRAKYLVNAKTDGKATDFYQLYLQSLTRRQLKPSFDIGQLQQLDEALSARGQRKILFAYDKNDGAHHAALYTCWDAETAYFLFWGINPKRKDSHAIQLLFWEAIQLLSAQVKYIDFCGSIIPEMERMIRSFGGVRRPCYVISKTGSKWLQIASIIINRGYF